VIRNCYSQMQDRMKDFFVHSMMHIRVVRAYDIGRDVWVRLDPEWRTTASRSQAHKSRVYDQTLAE
jgi:hypothetical protein